MVAHPDDCVIFGYSLMHHTPHWQWAVCYLTYQRSDPRGQEFSRFWAERGIDTLFLGCLDDYRDIEAGQPSFDVDAAARSIRDVCRFADVVLTHDQQGDYGHPHHRFVNQCVEVLEHPGLIRFAAPGTGTHRFTVDPVDYDAAALPLHYSIIRDFHPDRHANEYRIPYTLTGLIDS
jgi:LmbE family N-acetylglucosaminyl deacetylase